MGDKIDFDSLDTEQFWHYIAKHLKKHGYDTVLVGGAVVAVYSEDAYTSGDLDLVVINKFSIEVDDIMAEIGFYRRPERRYFYHPGYKKYLVEFPRGQYTVQILYRLKFLSVKPLLKFCRRLIVSLIDSNLIYTGVKILKILKMLLWLPRDSRSVMLKLNTSVSRSKGPIFIISLKKYYRIYENSY